MSTSRSKIVVKNIGLSFVARILTIVCTLLQIPVTLSILSKTEYGIWLTMYSVFGWFLVFDLGIGNGLKNKLTVALAKNDILLARKYISTAYVSISVLILAFIALFLCILPFINWIKFFSVPAANAVNFTWLVTICGVCTLFSFVINLIHTVLFSYHKIGLSGLLLFFPQLLLLIVTYVLKYYHVCNFFFIILLFILIPLLFNIVYTIIAFAKRYKEIRPSLKYYDKFFLKDILGLGLKFFIVQIALLIIYSTDNIFISHLYSPAKVTEYNIVVRYFTVLTLAFSVITAPMLALYTDAFSKNDYAWVRIQVKKLIAIWGLLIIAGFCMFLASSFVFHTWLGGSFNVSSPLLVIFVGIYTLQCIWNSIFNVAINGTGKIKLQVIYFSFSAAINIPLILFFNKLLHDVSSVMIANIVSLLIPNFLAYIQYKLIITRQSKGIYDK